MYNSPYLPANKRWQLYNRRQLSWEPVKLSAVQRKVIEDAIQETCSTRNWALYAINARTNHVHAVVAIGPLKPWRALNAFKANATRHMRESGCWPYPHSPWADKGSKRSLWNEKSIQDAIEYVLYGQGDEFD